MTTEHVAWSSERENDMSESGNGKKFGTGLGVQTWKWSKHGNVVDGLVTGVAKVIGLDFKKKDEKIQTKIEIVRDDRSRWAVYMPERWAEMVVPYIGQEMQFSSSEPGKVTTRYDAAPIEGAVPSTEPYDIPVLHQRQEDDGGGESSKDKRAKAKERARAES